MITNVLDHLDANQRELILAGNLDQQKDQSRQIQQLFDSKTLNTIEYEEKVLIDGKECVIKRKKQTSHSVLFFPEGRYRLDNGLILRSRKTIVGAGQGWDRKNPSEANPYLAQSGVSELCYTGNDVALRIGYEIEDGEVGPFVPWGTTSVSNLAFRGCSIRGDGTVDNGDTSPTLAKGGILLKNTCYIVLREVTVANFGDSSVDGTNDAYAIAGHSIVGLVLDRVHCSNSGIGLWAMPCKDLNTVWEARLCTFYGNKYGCIVRSLRGSSFQSCIFEQSKRNGINLQTADAHGISFYSCWSESNGTKAGEVGIAVNIGDARNIHFHNLYLQENLEPSAPYAMIITDTTNCSFHYLLYAKGAFPGNRIIRRGNNLGLSIIGEG